MKGFFLLSAHKLNTLTMLLLFFNCLQVSFLHALTVLKTKAMAGMLTSRHKEFLHYPLPAFSSLVEVKNCRCCSRTDYLGPMMLVCWALNPDHRVNTLIWVLSRAMNTPLKELRGVFFKSQVYLC